MPAWLQAIHKFIIISLLGCHVLIYRSTVSAGLVFMKERGNHNNNNIYYGGESQNMYLIMRDNALIIKYVSLIMYQMQSSRIISSGRANWRGFRPSSQVSHSKQHSIYQARFQSQACIPCYSVQHNIIMYMDSVQYYYNVLGFCSI